jgi:hypothetical protein
MAVAGVGRQHMACTCGTRGLGEQTVTGLARCRWQPRLRLCAAPAQGPVRQSEFGGEPLDLARLARRLSPQAVIDRDDGEKRAAREAAPPACRKPHQRDRVGPAGNGEHQRGRSSQAGEDPLGLARRDWRIVVV